MFNHLRIALLAIIAVLTTSNLLPAQKARVHPSQLVPIGKESAVRTQLPERPSTTQPSSAARTTAVNPIPLGSMPNIFSTSVPMNNCVYANDTTGAVVFIHRNDSTALGGSVFGIRYDISTDAGVSWNTNIGVMNPTYLSGRYPQIAGYNPSGNTAPLGSRAIFMAEHFAAQQWSGFNAGATELVTSGIPATQEILLTTPQQFSSGGMAEGLHGEYWTARITYDGLDLGDTLNIYKGSYNPGTQSISWALHASKTMPWSTSYSGAAHSLTPSVGFSPDGSVGWIAMLGDLATSNDTVYAPILLKSADGGATWANPQEIDLNSFSWVHDSLRALWVDSLGNPVSTGRATGGFHYDLTVDVDGNPHLFFVIGSASVTGGPPNYTIYSGLAKYAVDLFSTNQGSSYELRMVAPVLAFRAQFSGAVVNYVQDNYPQVSRTPDGRYILYSWVDTDTCEYTGSMLGAGFGVSDNILPNLWIAGLRLVDGFATCIHPVTQGDLTWEGLALTPQLAPEVLVSGSGPSSTYNLPVVMSRMPTMEPADPCTNHYFGNDAVLTEGDFAYPPGSTVSWMGCGLNPAITGQIQGKVFVDNNGNGVYDGGDAGIPGRVVETTGLTYADLTDPNGDFDNTVSAGYTYGLVTAPLNPLSWTPTAPTVPYNLNVATPGTVLTGNDFGFLPVANGGDLSVQVMATPMRPGFTSAGAIYLQNLGSMPLSGTLTFTYDPLITLSSATPAFTTNNTTTHVATWTLPTIPLFGTQLIYLDLYTPPGTPLNTNVHFRADVVASGPDIDPGNDADSCSVPVIGSYDPNDKTVLPSGVGANHQVDPGTELSYRIRFQNTGTASAINVEVRDTLDADLDILTLNMLGASHAYDFSIANGRMLVWRFDNIQLPDSNTNEPASHGFIDFSIRPHGGLPLGTVVENSASIYFDFNAPVQTNTAWITYDIASAAAPPAVLPVAEIRVYPHPVGDRAVVEYQGYGGKPWTFSLYDLQGRLLRNEAGIVAETYAFDRAGLPAGAYVYKVTAAGDVPKVGRMVME